MVWYRCSDPMVCNSLFSSLCKDQTTVAYVADKKHFDVLSENLLLKLQKNLKFKEYNSIKELHEFVASKEYRDLKEDQLCFGFEFKEIDKTRYEFNLSFYEDYTNYNRPIPKTEITKPNYFQTYPRPHDLGIYGSSGFLHVQKIFNEYIMKLTTGDDSTFNFGIFENFI
jgi:hypothetical protein